MPERAYVTAAIEYLKSGKLGEIHLVKVFNSKPRSRIGNPPDQPVPAGVDYDMWLGPAPMRPFNENHFHAWNWFWTYSGGDLVNDGVHQLDLTRWCTGRSHPRSVYSTGGLHFFKDAQDTPDTQIVTWDYDGLTMTFEQSLWSPYQQKTPMNLRDRDVLPKWPFNGTRVEIYGSKQWMMLGRHGDGWEVFDGDFKSVAHQFGRQANDEHVANFVDCIRSRKAPNADIEELHYSTLLCHYGNISYRLGRKLTIDPTDRGIRVRRRGQPAGQPHLPQAVGRSRDRAKPRSSWNKIPILSLIIKKRMLDPIYALDNIYRYLFTIVPGMDGTTTRNGEITQRPASA